MSALHSLSAAAFGGDALPRGESRAANRADTLDRGGRANAPTPIRTIARCAPVSLPASAATGCCAAFSFSPQESPEEGT
jgi:hypothetical protein